MTGHTQSIPPDHRARPISYLPRAGRRKGDGFADLELVITLTSRLQTTLELGSLIELFVEGIREVFLHDGASYRAPDNGQLIEFGSRSRHQVNYQLKVLEEPLGEIRFQRATRFAESEVQQLEKLLTVLLYPLRNALLYRAALQCAFEDALTGVKNRAAFESNFRREVEISRRKSGELSLLVLDIDLFKRVNDRYGHTVGDLVLKNVAQAVEASIRCSDALYRYGGEEFVVVLHGTDEAGAKLLAERIRHHIEGLAFSSPKELRVTLSIGLATLQREDRAEELFKRADAALYLAKHEGRNRVVSAGRL